MTTEEFVELLECFIEAKYTDMLPDSDCGDAVVLIKMRKILIEAIKNLQFTPLEK